MPKNRIISAAVLLVVASELGCAGTLAIEPMQVAAWVRADPMRTLASYRKRRVSFRGTVREKQLVGQTRSVSRVSVWMPGLVSVRSGQVSERLPLLVVDGPLYCYFDADELERVSRVEVGASYDFDCTFADVWGEAEQAGPVLGDCSVETSGK